MSDMTMHVPHHMREDMFNDVQDYWLVNGRLTKRASVVKGGCKAPPACSCKVQT